MRTSPLASICTTRKSAAAGKLSRMTSVAAARSLSAGRKILVESTGPSGWSRTRKPGEQRKGHRAQRGEDQLRRLANRAGMPAEHDSTLVRAICAADPAGLLAVGRKGTLMGTAGTGRRDCGTAPNDGGSHQLLDSSAYTWSGIMYLMPSSSNTVPDRYDVNLA